MMHRTPPDTAKRHKGKKPITGTSSSISRTPPPGSDTDQNEEELESPLGEFVDQTPRAHKPSHPPRMAETAAQDEIRRLQEQLAQAEAAFAEREDSVDTEEERVRQHEIQLKRLEQEANERAMQHELEMAKLQLQIEQAKAGHTTPAPIQIAQREDKVASFKKEVVAKSLKTSFKLEGSTNYESWRDEALTQALAIKAKHILNNNETVCPAGITDNDERKIWEVKSEALFDMLLAGVKPAIRQTIKARINEDDKNAAELWTAMETEYRIHAADIRMELMHKFATITIENNDVQQYISQFRDTCGKLKQMKFEIPQWQQNDRFIDGLKGHQATFVQAKRDDSKDPKNKATITELNLNELMDQLIARAIDNKDKQEPAQALKAESKLNEKSGLTPSVSQQDSTPSRQSSTRGSRRGRGGYDNNQQGWIKCGYCDRPWHDEQDCRYKNHTEQSKEWQTIHASAIEYFKKKNEGKTASPKPATATAPATPSTPAPTANPNVGYTAMAFSATTMSPKDLNNDDSSTESDDNDDMTYVTPRGTAILAPTLRIVGAEAVGATSSSKKKNLNSLSSRADVPKTRRGGFKKQSIVDPAVLLARDLTNSIIQDETSSEDPDIDEDRLGEG